MKNKLIEKFRKTWHWQALRHQLGRELTIFPARQVYQKIIDRMVYVVGVFVPMMTGLQVLKIWFFENAHGISVTAWLTWTVGSLIWVVYGIEHKERPIIVMYTLNGFFNFLVVLGAIIYA